MEIIENGSKTQTWVPFFSSVLLFSLGFHSSFSQPPPPGINITVKTSRKTRKHSSRIRTDRAVTRPSSEPVSMRSIVDTQTPVNTLPSLAVGNNERKYACGQ